MTFFPLVAICWLFKHPKVKFLQSPNQAEHYRKELYYLTGTKRDCT